MNNNNKPKLLTVKEFAEEQGISVCTVYQWMKKGLFGDLSKTPGEVFRIPETYLTSRGSPKKKKENPPRVYKDPFFRKSPANSEEAKIKFNSSRGKKISLPFDELKGLFDQGLSLREIAQKAGVTYQAISMLYKRYFAPYTVPNRQRRHNFVRERRIKQAENHFLSIEKMSRLNEIMTDLGFDVEPQVSSLPTRCSTLRVRVNGRLCGVYHLTSNYSPTPHRVYYRINLTRKNVSEVEYIIFFIGEGLEKVFVIPSRPLIELYLPKQRSYSKIFYIPREKYPIYKNQYPKIDWFSYESNWDQLKKKKDIN